MKKILTALFATLLITGIAYANDPIYSIKMQDNVTVSAGSTDTSSAITIEDVYLTGSFSLQVTLTGSGTAKIEYLLSNDGTNYLEPSSGSDIVTAHTVSSGPGSDGKDMYSFHPMIAKYIKIKVTETGSSNSVTLTTTLVYQ